jgi:hypothetical protein
VTRTIFALHDLTELYVRSLAPTVYSRKYYCDLPVWFVYNYIIAKVEKDAKEEPPTSNKYKKYKADLLGEDTIKTAPERYWDIQLALELGISLTDWDSLDKYPLRAKAEIRAQKFLKGMVDVVERHYKLQDEALERWQKSLNDGKS